MGTYACPEGPRDLHLPRHVRVWCARSRVRARSASRLVPLARRVRFQLVPSVCGALRVLFLARAGITLAATCFLLGSCVHNDQTGPSNTNPGVVLRAGVSVFDSAPPDLGPLGIVDVAQDGSQIAVLVGEVTVPVLFMSSDQGLTWARHTLPPEPGTGLTAPQMQVHLYAGHVTLINTASNNGNDFYQFQDVNLTTNTYTTNSGGMRVGFLYFLGAQILSYDNEVPQPPTALDGYRLFSYSVSTKAVTLMGGQYTAPSPDCQGYPWGSPDGHRFSAFCFTNVPAPTTCEVAVNTQVSLAPTTACVPATQWHPYQANPSNLPRRQYFTGSGGRAEAYASGGHVYLATLASFSPASVAPPLDLGTGTDPGGFYGAISASSHERYNGMVAVGPPPSGGGSSRLVRVPASGPPVNVPVPPSACPGGQACASVNGGVTIWPYGQLAWLLPLGNDDYLVFYVVHRGNDPNSAAPDIIYMSREHAPPTAL